VPACFEQTSYHPDQPSQRRTSLLATVNIRIISNKVGGQHTWRCASGGNSTDIFRSNSQRGSKRALAAKTSFLFGLLAKLQSEDDTRIWRGRFSVAETAAAAGTFLATGFGSRFDAHENLFVHRLAPATVAVGARFAGTVAMLRVDNRRTQLHRRRAPFPIAAARSAGERQRFAKLAWLFD